MDKIDEVLLTLGRIEGSVKATNRSVNDKFDVIQSDVKEQKNFTLDQEKRILSLETDRKWVTRLSAIVAGAISIIITTISRLWGGNHQ